MAVKYKYNEKRKEWATLVYDGTVNEYGEKHRKRISSKKSSKDLENKVAEFKASLQEKGATDTAITLREYSAKWLDLYKSNRELNTIKMYKNAINYFKPIEDIKICDLTRSHVQLVINLNKDHARTCIIVLQTLKQVLYSAVLDGILSEKAYLNAISKIDTPKYKKTEKKPLAESEKEALLNCSLDDKKRAFVSLLYYCGLRKQEALALETSDFDFNNMTLSINKVIVYDGNNPVLKPYPKSDNGVRVLPLSRACFDALKDYVADCKGVLFKSQNSAYMTAQAYKRMWQGVEKAMSDYAGEPVHINAHQLRHNYCTLLCYQVPTISTKTIARLLGDNENMVLNVYSHILEAKEDLTTAITNAFD